MANNDWINQVIEDTMRGKQFKRCIQSGIDHLEGKKLYKYYSFSSAFLSFMSLKLFKTIN